MNPNLLAAFVVTNKPFGKGTIGRVPLWPLVPFLLVYVVLFFGGIAVLAKVAAQRIESNKPQGVNNGRWRQISHP